MDLTISNADPIQLKVEKFFCGQLNGFVGEVVFGPSRSDSDTIRPPYGVVLCDKLDEVRTGDRVYACDAKIAILTSIDQSTSATHQALVAALLDRLNAMDRNFDSVDFSLLGFSVQGMSDIAGDEDTSYADVVNIRCGVRG